MKLSHACLVLAAAAGVVPDGMDMATFRWRCPTCRQRWSVRAHHGSATARRIGRSRFLRPTNPPSETS